MATANKLPADVLLNIGSLSMRALAVVSMMAATDVALAGDKTLSVVESVDVASTPSKTWDTIKDFGAWQAWHPAFAGTVLLHGDGRSRGTVRVLTTKDGGKFTEELVAYSPAAHSYQYRIIESPAPVMGYVSTIAVKQTKGGSSVVWSSTFKVNPGTSDDDAKKLISGVYRAGLDNLAAVLR